MYKMVILIENNKLTLHFCAKGDALYVLNQMKHNLRDPAHKVDWYTDSNDVILMLTFDMLRKATIYMGPENMRM
ncbi:MAG TPA: hypothetical protein VI911_02370 [Patescibacteria group bacterium]|nr:hypothetical protein [Patescibacteria group bacterium]